jgi:hypothetical protein
MVVAKLNDYIKAISGRKWTDQEMIEDIDFLNERLQESIGQLTYPYPIAVRAKYQLF